VTSAARNVSAQGCLRMDALRDRQCTRVIICPHSTHTDACARQRHMRFHRQIQVSLNMLGRYPKVAQYAARRNLIYEGFLLALLDEELAQRDENMQKRRLAAAKLPTLKTLDQYDFSLMPLPEVFAKHTPVAQARHLDLRDTI